MRMRFEEATTQEYGAVKKFVLLSLAASAVAAFASVSTPVEARTFIVTETRSPLLACYNREYVPATVRVNTRGRLVRRESRGWEITGDRWNHVRYPATYI